MGPGFESQPGHSICSNTKCLRGEIGRHAILRGWYPKDVLVRIQSQTRKIKITDLVAQLVEQYTFNVWVLGSNPSQVTIKLKIVIFFILIFCDLVFKTFNYC